MRPPNDLEDYSQCVRMNNEILKAFCVECDQWREILIRAIGTVLFHQRLVLKQVSDCHSLTYVCRQCSADISYLLSEKQKFQLIKKTDIPVMVK